VQNQPRPLDMFAGTHPWPMDASLSDA